MGAWFEIDRKGMADVVGRRDDKSFVLAELVQNAWDAPGTATVSIDLRPDGRRGRAFLSVEDDSPEGFADLRHAFTLFAPSAKRGDPTLRGRFNLGEKLVLSICSEATIETTTGTVRFDDEGRHRSSARRPRGTRFSCVLPMTRPEIDAAVEHLRSFIAPTGIATTINGETLAARTPFETLETVLPTEIADAEGRLRPTSRRTRLSLHRPPEGRVARVYEMGIPVAETGDAFDVDVAQKIPLSLERDTVRRSWLEKMRVAVAGAAYEHLTPDDASAPWVGEAMSSPDLPVEAVASIMRRRFGDKVVVYDPSDREANDRATAQGYVVLSGGSMTKTQWNSVRRAGTVLPAGRVVPTPKPFSKDGEPAVHAQATPAMERFSDFVRRLGHALLDRPVGVQYYERFNAVAAYGGGCMFFNVGRLGRTWFEGPLRAEQLDLVIHELGHEKESNHLSKLYNDALTDLGARATMLALSNPEMFDLSR